MSLSRYDPFMGSSALYDPFSLFLGAPLGGGGGGQLSSSSSRAGQMQQQLMRPMNLDVKGEDARALSLEGERGAGGGGFGEEERGEEERQTNDDASDDASDERRCERWTTTSTTANKQLRFLISLTLSFLIFSLLSHRDRQPVRDPRRRARSRALEGQPLGGR